MKITSYLQFSIISPGLFTTVQDMGRYGFQKFGVPITGALDSFAAQMANFLVGNDSNAALLEFTVVGPRLLVMTDAFVAITGAEMEIKRNGTFVSSWKAFRVKPGDLLEVGQTKSGCRGYLAVTGGIEVPLVMNSRSSYVGGKIGGVEGRPLTIGDKLARGIGVFLDEPRKLPQELVPQFNTEIVLRAIPGPQDDYFDEDLEKFFNSEFTVSPEANRMGYRLDGPEIKQKEGMPGSIISESSLPGGVQIPPNGLPIILLVEQTVGGYTKIATVISSDLDLVAQASPGDRIRFERVSLEAAYSIKREQAQELENIKQVVEMIAQVKQSRQKKPVYREDKWLRIFKELYPEC